MAAHYSLEKQPPDIQLRAKEGRLDGPYFIGQGVTIRSGSDAYGHYIVDISPDFKTIALVDADTQFTKSWEDGSMTSTMPVNAFSQDKANLEWLQFYGGKWYSAYWSNAEGKVIRRKGCKEFPNWNGAYDYRDPSL